jgi:hypothetical protein
MLEGQLWTQPKILGRSGRAVALIVIAFSLLLLSEETAKRLPRPAGLDKGLAVVGRATQEMTLEYSRPARHG